MKFREDINALRAIAVIAVVIFHFNHSWLPGGFAGVDVFFVISGFLMTMIIIKGLDRETFSIIDFYKARVRRIIPALAFLCFVLMVLGYFLLSPIDYLNMGKHTTASLTFTSNFVYWKESNYFDASSIEKWLLHTWSLSVEWQFYLIYPVVLVVLKKFLNLKQLKLLLVAATILTLLLSIYVTFNTSRAAYFLLPTRAWQMLAGGLVFLYPIALGQKGKSFGLMSGLAMIVFSFFLFSAETPWPGYASLLPILGACLVLISNNGESVLVDNKICHLLGKWSYSIYLWHWPIIVAGFYFSLGDNWWVIGLPLSILLGALSFVFIESKTLADYGLNKGRYLLKPLPAASIIAVFGLVVFQTNGLLERLAEPERTLVASAIAAKDDWSYPDANKFMGPIKIRLISGKTDKNILILGASHTEQLYPYVKSLNSDYNVYFLTNGGCLATPSMKHPKWNCDNLQNYEFLLDSVKFEKIVTSFFSFDVYLSDIQTERQEQISVRTKEYDTFLARLKAASDDVYLILGEPKGEEFNPQTVIRNGLNDFITEEQARKNYTIHQKALGLFTELSDIKIIDPIEYLCNEGICRTSNTSQGFFYRDNNHMRPWYAVESLTYLEDIFLE
ncbi:acyltransferase family protein [Paraglaciecola chathamensis]|uniref:Acyltransferase 3 n=1 Tax=Paraglaciecola chathamensis S18K6 TaxID=1127672 RepID=A0AAV3V6H9_9ALTE|nr:acyltransferase family protein [Paraglaciecola chathamensis]GAC12228.1 acyltransferase 3 [Paraglaciecola chathamensis S18K6]